MNKLAVDDRVQAAVVALRSGLVKWPWQAPIPLTYSWSMSQATVKSEKSDSAVR
jgi:uncharacterized protein YdhG (YjbR/CyaY superfamily)